MKHILRRFKQHHITADDILKAGSVPKHVAIIMDGNGRWAKKFGLPRAAGHHTGMKNVKKITIAAKTIGVEVLTLYAFSTENWKRPKEEVDYLMKLPQEFFPLEIEDLEQNNIQVRMTGSKEQLPEFALKPIENAIERTRHNDGMILNFALNYGSRLEIVHAAKHLAEDLLAGRIHTDDINEQALNDRLLTSDLPDPDLLIRTSGELRLSNFMLWQLAYTEFWFTEAYWPEFNEPLFYSAIREYQNRARRYGGL
ncbi:isoprenyl transferase [Marinicrinis lubricantis]|uniref:Isoprenyl transferase n=1 Tax=Marinicrinis lubricantis TaxID=2086470 RepID=A0ABW1IME5_9BACL